MGVSEIERQNRLSLLAVEAFFREQSSGGSRSNVRERQEEEKATGGVAPRGTCGSALDNPNARTDGFTVLVGRVGRRRQVRFRRLG